MSMFKKVLFCLSVLLILISITSCDIEYLLAKVEDKINNQGQDQNQNQDQETEEQPSLSDKNDWLNNINFSEYKHTVVAEPNNLKYASFAFLPDATYRLSSYVKDQVRYVSRDIPGYTNFAIRKYDDEMKNFLDYKSSEKESKAVLPVAELVESNDTQLYPSSSVLSAKCRVYDYEGFTPISNTRASSSNTTLPFGVSHKNLKVGETFDCYVNHSGISVYPDTVEVELFNEYTVDGVTIKVFMEKEWLDIQKNARTFIDQVLRDTISRFVSNYGPMTETFTSPLDRDGNNAINFVFHSYVSEGVLGYFVPFDLWFTGSETEGISNEGEFLYYPFDLFFEASDSLKYSNAYYYAVLDTYVGTMVHEFQHLLHTCYQIKNNFGYFSTSYVTWITEGLSMCAESLMGYSEISGLGDYVITYLLDSNRYSLLGVWPQGESAPYGQAYLFIRYLMSRFGEQKIIKGLYDINYLQGDLNIQWDDVRQIEYITGLSIRELYADFATMLIRTGIISNNESKYNVAAFNGEEISLAECLQYTSWNATINAKNNAKNGYLTNIQKVFSLNQPIYAEPMSLIFTCWTDEAFTLTNSDGSKTVYDAYDSSNEGFTIISDKRTPVAISLLHYN